MPGSDFLPNGIASHFNKWIRVAKVDRDYHWSIFPTVVSLWQHSRDAISPSLARARLRWVADPKDSGQDWVLAEWVGTFRNTWRPDRHFGRVKRRIGSQDCCQVKDSNGEQAGQERCYNHSSNHQRNTFPVISELLNLLTDWPCEWKMYGKWYICTIISLMTCSKPKHFN